MTEYHFDGFRFDGVTSMLYHDHGLGTDFNSNDKYFSYNTHTEAITYLQLANELIRQVNPKAITVAEDKLQLGITNQRLQRNLAQTKQILGQLFGQQPVGQAIGTGFG